MDPHIHIRAVEFAQPVCRCVAPMEALHDVTHECAHRSLPGSGESDRRSCETCPRLTHSAKSIVCEKAQIVAYLTVMRRLKCPLKVHCTSDTLNLVMFGTSHILRPSKHLCIPRDITGYASALCKLSSRYVLINRPM
eukprot:5551562-Amphidinium_carterae.1